MMARGRNLRKWLLGEFHKDNEFLHKEGGFLHEEKGFLHEEGVIHNKGEIHKGDGFLKSDIHKSGWIHKEGGINKGEGIHKEGKVHREEVIHKDVKEKGFNKEKLLQMEMERENHIVRAFHKEDKILKKGDIHIHKEAESTKVKWVNEISKHNKEADEKEEHKDRVGRVVEGVLVNTIKKYFSLVPKLVR